MTNRPFSLTHQVEISNESPYFSRHFPANQSYRSVLSTWVIRPIAFCMLPVMIGALIAILEGFPGLPFLTIGFPLALICASVWAWFRIQVTPAALYIREGAASLQTVWESLRSPSKRQWLPIFELRRGPSFVTLALGDATYYLEHDDWPDLEALLNALHEARSTYHGRP